MIKHDFRQDLGVGRLHKWRCDGDRGQSNSSQHSRAPSRCDCSQLTLRFIEIAFICAQADIRSAAGKPFMLYSQSEFGYD